MVGDELGQDLHDAALHLRLLLAAVNLMIYIQYILVAHSPISVKGAKEYVAVNSTKHLFKLTVTSTRESKLITLDPLKMSMAAASSPASAALAASVFVAVLNGAATASKSSRHVTPDRMDLWKQKRLW